MKFKDLIDKYDKGKASDEEKILIEEELEKYEAIEEYFAERLDMDFMSIEENEDRKEDTINLKRSVNNRLRKVVFKSLALFTISLIGIFFVLSPIIGSFYYNPAKVSVGKENRNIEFDLKALTDLNLPGYKFASSVNIDNLGFGVYDILFFRRNLYTQENKNISLKIKRDNRSDTSENSFREMYINFMSIRHPDTIKSQQIIDQKERVVNHIKKLSPVSYTSTYLTFEEDLTMDELREIQFNYPDIDFVWAGIRTSTPGEPVNNITGFGLDFNGDPVAFDNPDEEKYPAFNFLDWVVNNNEKSSETSLWTKGYELHYTSLLKYMVDRKEAVDVFFYNNLKTEYYQSSLNYIEENGVKTFGILVYANAEDIIELIENEAIKTVELDQVMASRRYVH